MKISQNSTQSLYGNLRHSMATLQRDLIDAQKEVSTGRVSDAGLRLGTQNGQRISMNLDIERFDTIITTNDLAQARLEMSLTATGAINEIGQSLMDSLTAISGQYSGGGLASKAGQSAIASITGILNTSFNGEALFGGINSGQHPISSYESGGAKLALEMAFTNHFGFAKTNPAALSISASQMTQFLDTVVEPMFSGNNWQTIFSSASDDVMTSRISLTETGASSVTANEAGFQGMMLAAVIASEFFTEALNAEAQTAASTKALSVIGTSLGELADLQGRTGFLIGKIEGASDRLKTQMNELTIYSNAMDSVDPYEAATRLNSRVTEIETAYRLTGRIQQLSLMNFI